MMLHIYLSERKHHLTVRRLRSIMKSLYNFHIYYCINSQIFIPRLMIKFHTIPLHNKLSQCSRNPIAITVRIKCLVNAKVVYIRDAFYIIILTHLKISQTNELLHTPTYWANYHVQHIRRIITTFTFTTAMSVL
jgi:hypothetical protein